ncbi:MAG: hypothetical protein JWR36_1265 [Glaciihabitans sp.]|nr:hypothetical protein [Glaciihabitans sp.]
MTSTSASPVGRRRARALAVIAGIGLIIAGTTFAAVPAKAAVAGCNDYEFIGARGSAEDDTTVDPYSGDDLGMGPSVHEVYADLAIEAAISGVTLGGYGMHFPALPVWKKDSYSGEKNWEALTTGAMAALHAGGPYALSVAAGATDATAVVKRIKTIESTCSSTKFILVGYSQGAQAIGEAIEKLTPSERTTIVATALFGDPRFNAKDVAADRSNFQTDHYGAIGVRGIWSSLISSPVLSYCHTYDPFCNGDVATFIPGTYVHDFRHLAAVSLVTGDPTSQHTNYSTKGDTRDAANHIAALLNFGTKVVPTAPTDIVFVIDSTSSMRNEIDSVASNVVQLADTIAATSTDFRFALVDYKDDPDNDSSYQSRVDVPFTKDTAQFTAGVKSIRVAGGGDESESMYSGIMTAFALPWREGVKKTVVIIGDAPGKDPEPVTGYTLDDVTKKAFAIDPAQVYSVPVKGEPSIFDLRIGGSDTEDFMTSISDATGGTVTTAATTAEFLASLKSAVIQAGSAPIAVLSGPGSALAGETVQLSAAGTTSDPNDPIVGYDWNFGNGTAAGSYDQTTTSPRVSTSYTSTGEYTASVRVRVQSGLSGLATASVKVAAQARAKPSTPRALKASLLQAGAKLSWKPSKGASYYLIESGKSGHKVVGGFTVADASAPVTWTDVGAKVPHTYRVVAVNSAGESAPSKPVVAAPPIVAPTVGAVLLKLIPWAAAVLAVGVIVAVLAVLLRRRRRDKRNRRANRETIRTTPNDP